MAVILLFTTYTLDTEAITFPFEGMSRNEDGFYCLHGRDPQLLRESRGYLFQGLKRWMDDTSVKVLMILSDQSVDLT